MSFGSFSFLVLVFSRGFVEPPLCVVVRIGGDTLPWAVVISAVDVVVVTVDCCGCVNCCAGCCSRYCVVGICCCSCSCCVVFSVVVDDCTEDVLAVNVSDASVVISGDVVMVRGGDRVAVAAIVVVGDGDFVSGNTAVVELDEALLMFEEVPFSEVTYVRQYIIIYYKTSVVSEIIILYKFVLYK